MDNWAVEGLAIEPCRIEEAIPEQCCQPHEITWILCEVTESKGVSQVVCARFFGNQFSSRLRQFSVYLSYYWEC